MNNSLTVNLFGGPGTGKSTTSAAVFSLLKMHGVNAELITEFAKDLTWEKRYVSAKASGDSDSAYSRGAVSQEKK